MNKIFMKIIKNRIEKTNFNQPIDQAGFRKGFSTNDHLHFLNQIIEKAKEYQIEIYLAFLYYAKAFDSVDQVCVFRAMTNQRIDPGYIQTIYNSYKVCQAPVIVDEPGPFFPVNREVKQGDPISPLLLNCVLEEMFKNLKWEQ